MVHTVIEVMRMDKKFIAAVAVCFVALVGVATGTYFLGQKSDENIVKLGKANITETTAADKNIEDLYKKINFNIPQFSHHRKC